jgi:hypothetical protein
VVREHERVPGDRMEWAEDVMIVRGTTEDLGTPAGH